MSSPVYPLVCAGRDLNPHTFRYMALNYRDHIDRKAGMAQGQGRPWDDGERGTGDPTYNQTMFPKAKRIYAIANDFCLFRFSNCVPNGIYTRGPFGYLNNCLHSQASPPRKTPKPARIAPEITRSTIRNSGSSNSPKSME